MYIAFLCYKLALALALYIIVIIGLPQILLYLKERKCNTDGSLNEFTSQNRQQRIRLLNALYLTLLPIPLIIGAYYLGTLVGMDRNYFFVTMIDGVSLSIRNEYFEHLWVIYGSFPLIVLSFSQLIALLLLRESGKVKSSILLAIIYILSISLIGGVLYLLYSLASSGYGM